MLGQHRAVKYDQDKNRKKVTQINEKVNKLPQITQWVEQVKEHMHIVNIGDFNDATQNSAQSALKCLELLLIDKGQVKIQQQSKNMHILQQNNMPQQYKINGAKFYEILASRLLKQNSFLNLKSIFKILKRYNLINDDLYYPKGKFNYGYIKQMLRNAIMDQNELIQRPFFNKMIDSINQYISYIVMQCHGYFDQVQKDISRGHKVRQNKNLQNIIWNLFENYAQNSKAIIRNPFVSHTMIMTTIARGLNYCLIRDRKSFAKRPKFIVNLTKFIILLKQRAQINCNYKGLQHFLQNLHLQKRYSQSSQQQKDELFDLFGQFVQIQQKIFAKMKLIYFQIFIQQFSIINRQNNFIQFNNDLHASSAQDILWNILDTNPFILWDEPYQSYHYVWLYIASIFNIDNQLQQDTLENRFCHLIKIINLMCFNPLQAKLDQFIKNIQLKYTHLFQYLYKCMFEGNIRNSYSVDQNQQKNRICQEIYTFIHNLIIYGMDDVLQKFIKYINQHNVDYYRLLQQIFVTYLQNYNQMGQNIHICLKALNKTACSSSTQYQRIMGHLSSLEMLQKQLLPNLFTSQSTYLIILQQFLTIIKDNKKQLLNQQWFIILAYFMKNPSKTSIDSRQYANILLNVLRQLNNKQSLLQLFKKHFDFKYLQKYFSQVFSFLYIDSSSQYQHFQNKSMKKREFQSVKMAIDILKLMVNLYKLQKSNPQNEYLPYNLRKLLQTTSNSSECQIKLKNYGTNYQTMMVILFTSKQFNINTQEKINLLSLKNDVLELMIEFNKINNALQSQHLFIQTFISLYKKNINFGNKRVFYGVLCDQMLKRPNYLLFKYLIDNKIVPTKLEKIIFKNKDKKIQNINLSIDKNHNFKDTLNDKEISILKNKSTTIIYCCEQLQRLQTIRKRAKNSNISPNHVQNEQQIKKRIRIYFTQINAFLRQLKADQIKQQSSEIYLILQNIYKVINNIFKISTHHTFYKELVLNLSFILFDINLNKPYILNNSSTQSSSLYRQAILTLLNTQQIIKPPLFSQIIGDKYLEHLLFVFIRQCLTKMKQNGNIYCQSILFEFIEFGLCFMMGLQKDFHEQFTLFGQIISQIHKTKSQAQISYREIIIVIIINTYINKKIQGNSYANHKYWPLIINVKSQKDSIAIMILRQFDKIYGQHPIFFMNCCKYLIDMCRSPSIEGLFQHNYQQKLTLIMDVLWTSMKQIKTYHSVWIIQILIQIINSPLLKQQKVMSLLKQMLNNIFMMNILRQRLTILMKKIQANINKDNKINKDSITFQQKNELMIYFRWLTMIHFHPSYPQVCYKDAAITQQNQSFTQNAQYLKDQILQIMISIIKIVGCLFQQKTISITPVNQSQKTMYQIQIPQILTYISSIEQSSLRRYNAESLNMLLDKFYYPTKGISLYLIDDCLNIQISSLAILWISQTQNRQRLRPAIYNIFALLVQIQRKLKTYIEISLSKQQQSIISDIYKMVNRKMYLSEKLQRQMLFTNCGYLSSSLLINLKEIKQKMRDNFYYCFKIIAWFKNNEKQKLQSTLLKKFGQLVDKLIRDNLIEQQVRGAGSILRFEQDRMSNQSLRTNQRFTITKTIRAS